MNPTANANTGNGEVFSLFRLVHALENQLPLPSVVKVGGRYNEENSKAWLVSGVYALELSQSLKAAPHSFVVTEISRENLKFANRTEAGTWIYGEKWSRFLYATRQFFHAAGLLEMTTPSLVKNPGMEPELEPFSTTWKSDSRRETLFLPTSPELHLKQLMAQGYTDIFEIKTVFRNEELTQNHEPEFQMLEWYRGFADLSAVVQDLEGYIRFLQREVFAQKEIPRLEKWSVREVFAKFTGFQLQPQTTAAELLALAQKLDLAPSAELSWNDLFHLIWVAKVEENLPHTPFLLTEYPPSQAALAKLTAEGWADRFEFYWRGVEIANAFHELTDPVEQRRRFERDQELRLRYGRTSLAIDENFMTALEKGLPPSAGVALGLDRLFMVMADLRVLNATKPFSIEHQRPTGTLP